MLIGEFQHNIDAKGRVFIPSRFREDLGERFILCKGLDECLFVYSMDEWKNLEQKIRQLPLSRARNLQRFLFSGATDLEADKQGRVVIPQQLRKYAALESEAMIIGASIRAEVWALDRWEATCSQITPDSVAEAMEELGF